MLYKLENGNIRRAPKNGILNGQGVSNLDRLFEADLALAAANGYYTLDTSAPEPSYDEETHHLKNVYKFDGEKIVRTFATEANDVCD